MSQLQLGARDHAGMCVGSILTVRAEGIISVLCLDIDMLLGDLPTPPHNLALRLGFRDRGGALNGVTDSL